MTDVTTIRPGTVFAWFMLVLIIRRLIVIITLIITRQTENSSSTRQSSGDERRRNTRDENTNGEPKPDADTRLNLIITNDSENDTYFLILLLSMAAFSDSLEGNVIRTIAYASVYAFLRIVYAIAVMIWLPAIRSLSWLLAFLCIVAINLDLVITMSRRSN